MNLPIQRFLDPPHATAQTKDKGYFQYQGPHFPIIMSKLMGRGHQHDIHDNHVPGDYNAPCIFLDIFFCSFFFDNWDPEMKCIHFRRNSWGNNCERIDSSIYLNHQMLSYILLAGMPAAENQ